MKKIYLLLFTILTVLYVRNGYNAYCDYKNCYQEFPALIEQTNNILKDVGYLSFYSKSNSVEEWKQEVSNLDDSINNLKQQMKYYNKKHDAFYEINPVLAYWNSTLLYKLDVLSEIVACSNGIVKQPIDSPLGHDLMSGIAQINEKNDGDRFIVQKCRPDSLNARLDYDMINHSVSSYIMCCTNLHATKNPWKSTKNKKKSASY